MERSVRYGFLAVFVVVMVSLAGTWILVLRPSRERLRDALASATRSQTEAESKTAALTEQERNLAVTNGLLEEVIDGMEQGLVVFSNDPPERRTIILSNAKASSTLEVPPELVSIGARYSDFIDFFLDREGLGSEEQGHPC